MNALYTKLTLVNKALIKIGAKTITDLASTTEPNAVIMNKLYEQCRDEVAEEGPFSFFIQQVALVPLNPQAWVTGNLYIVGTYVLQGGAIYVCAIQHTSGVFATDLTAGDWVLQSGIAPLLLPLPTMNDGVQYAYAIPSDYVSLYMVNVPFAQIREQVVKTPFLATSTFCLLSDQAALVARYVYRNDDPATYSSKFYDALACKLALEACFKISEAAQYAAKMESDYNKALMSALSADSKNNSPDQGIANEWFIARLAGSGVVTGLPNGNIGFFPDPFNPDF